jgi:hypothetical protein
MICRSKWTRKKRGDKIKIRLRKVVCRMASPLDAAAIVLAQR